MGFTASTFYKAWAARLRVPFLAGTKGRAVMGAFSQVLGDSTIDWANASLYERLPEFASSTPLGLIASERQLDTSAQETTAALAIRETYATAISKYYGTPLGLLLGLHFSGFDGAKIVTQNGNIYSLTTPLPTMVSGQQATWDPTPSLVTTTADALVTALTSSVTPSRSIPAGTPWFFFDNNTDQCNRFAVIYPTWPFSALTQAFFNNSDVATATFPFAFGDTTYSVIYGPPSAPVILTVDGTSKTTTTVNILASGQWTGSVWVTAYATGVNPLNTFSSVPLLKNSITRWRPEKAICMGVFAIQSGEMWDWPVGLTWDGDSNLWDSSSVSQILGAF